MEVDKEVLLFLSECVEHSRMVSGSVFHTVGQKK